MKSAFLSKQFFIRWVKRILTFKSLIVYNSRRISLTNLGAKIASTAEIGLVKIDGIKCNFLLVSSHLLVE